MSNDLLITSKTTGLFVELRPPGGAGAGPRVELVLRLAMTECHAWLGIGGRSGPVRRPRRISREKRLSLDVRRSGGDCRRLIRRAIKGSLREEEEYRGLTLAHWDKAVPQGVERAIAVAVQRGGGGSSGSTLKVSVDIRVRFKFVYCEAKALLLACDDDNSAGRRSGNGDGDGEAPSCSICFAEMSRDAGEVTDLPGCTHGFHFWCIASWFYKASTCPVRRRDQRQFLPPEYRDLHGKMTIDPDSLPDYPSVVVV